jgi:hypothetical protein
VHVQFKDLAFVWVPLFLLRRSKDLAGQLHPAMTKNDLVGKSGTGNSYVFNYGVCVTWGPPPPSMFLFYLTLTRRNRLLHRFREQTQYRRCFDHPIIFTTEDHDQGSPSISALTQSCFIIFDACDPTGKRSCLLNMDLARPLPKQQAHAAHPGGSFVGED